VARLSGERRLGGRSAAGRFYNIKQIGQQISRHTHEACSILMLLNPSFAIAAAAPDEAAITETSDAPMA
jgi:hypothetical protein